MPKRSCSAFRARSFWRARSTIPASSPAPSAVFARAFQKRARSGAAAGMAEPLRTGWGRAGPPSRTGTAPVLLQRFDAADSLVGGPQRIGDIAEIHQSRVVPVAFRNLRRSGRVPHHRDFVAAFQKVIEMGLNAEIGRHARQNHLVDSTLAQLEVEVVRLRTVDLVRARHDGLAVKD